MPELQPPILVTYEQRIAYDTGSVVLGQCFIQTDEHHLASAGFYYWTGVNNGFVYASSQRNSPTIMRGEGPHLFASGGFIFYNFEKSAAGAFGVISNPTGNDFLVGWYDGGFVGLEISDAGETAISSRYGQTLGLWLRTANGLLVRVMDLSADTETGRLLAALRYGNGTNFGRVGCVPTTDLSEGANSGGSETDALTWAMGGNSLVINNSGMRFRARGVCAANGNAKRARMTIGATTIADTGSVAANNVPYELEAEVWRTSASAIKFWGRAAFGGVAPVQTQGTATLDLSTSQNVVVKLTGVSSSDITQKIFYPETVF